MFLEVEAAEKTVDVVPLTNTALIEAKSKAGSLAKLDVLNEASGELIKSSPKPEVKKESRFLGLTHRQLKIGAVGAAIAELLVHGSGLAGIAFLGGAAALAYPNLKKIKRGKLGLHLMTAAGVATSGALWMHLNAQPAQALFFSNAETFFKTTFALSANAVTLIFNVFRAMYVLYLIYSAVSIWTSYNRDEDWMSVAKAPIVVFVGGTIIDIVTTMIVA